MPDYAQLIVPGILVLAGISVFWFAAMMILREFMCWYFKINDIVKVLQEQKGLLARMAGVAKSRPAHAVTGGNQPNENAETAISVDEDSMAAAPAEHLEECPFCHKMSRKAEKTCEHCLIVKV